MALETLREPKIKLSGINQVIAQFPDENNHKQENCLNFIQVNHDTNEIKFKLQDGPVKENGINGCQVTDMIAVAKHIISGLNQKFPDQENVNTIFHLWEALEAQGRRTANREKRGVEGTNVR